MINGDADDVGVDEQSRSMVMVMLVMMNNHDQW